MPRNKAQLATGEPARVAGLCCTCSCKSVTARRFPASDAWRLTHTVCGRLEPVVISLWQTDVFGSAALAVVSVGDGGGDAQAARANVNVAMMNGRTEFSLKPQGSRIVAETRRFDLRLYNSESEIARGLECVGLHNMRRSHPIRLTPARVKPVRHSGWLNRI
jgi:hypothetical protein